MRIKRDSVQHIEANAPRFLLVADAMDGEILIEKDEEALLRLSVTEEGQLTLTATYSGGEVLRLEAEGAYRREVIVTQGYARLALYVDGVLLDEDFFLGEMDFGGADIKTKTFMHFEAGFEYHSAMESTPLADLFSDLPDGFRPIGREMSVLSVRPALLGDRLHLLYIDCRRGGKVKSGLGAFRVQALYTENGTSFGTAPVAVPVDSKEEYGALDAHAVWENGRGYLYYLCRQKEGVSLKVAVSEDGYSFLKTGLDAEVPALSPEKITALCLWKDGGRVRLMYAEDGRLYAADSVDLLRFAAPKPIASPVPVDDFQLFAQNGVAYALLRNENGVFLSSLEKDTLGEPVPQALDMEKPRAISYQGRLYLFGVKNGALCAKRAAMESGRLTLLS